jgi:hypothetical protein
LALPSQATLVRSLDIQQTSTDYEKRLVIDRDLELCPVPPSVRVSCGSEITCHKGGPVEAAFGRWPIADATWEPVSQVQLGDADVVDNYSAWFGRHRRSGGFRISNS